MIVFTSLAKERIIFNDNIQQKTSSAFVDDTIYNSHLSKVFGNVKKSLYNQPKPYFFQKNYCEVISG